MCNIRCVQQSWSIILWMKNFYDCIHILHKNNNFVLSSIY
nr:MAG TPA: hypothetical protein [Caudoviricetes sp.]